MPAGGSQADGFFQRSRCACGINDDRDSFLAGILKQLLLKIRILRVQYGVSAELPRMVQPLRNQIGT